MSWTPTQNVIDLSPIVENLFAFIEENQSDALEWAGGGGLQSFRKLYTSAAGRVSTVFPCLMVTSQDLAEQGEDLITGAFALSFEAEIQGGNTDELVRDAKVYDKALRSMLTNISNQQLTAGTEMIAILQALDSRIDVLGKSGGAYSQLIRLRATFSLKAEAYND